MAAALLVLCVLVVTVIAALYVERRELRRQIRDGIVVDAAWVLEHVEDYCHATRWSNQLWVHQTAQLVPELGSSARRVHPDSVAEVEALFSRLGRGIPGVLVD